LKPIQEDETVSQQPSNWQKAITGEWHGIPTVFEPDGTAVGFNQVSRASEFADGKTTYWLEADFQGAGPIATRFDMGRSRMSFGVIDSDQDRVYCGPDFIGGGRPFGMLVDSNYYSPYWNTDLRTVNLVIPERKMQVYSSLFHEGPTIVAVQNGLYTVTQDRATNPETQAFVDRFIAREREIGRKQHVLPVKFAGQWRGTLQVHGADQSFLGEAQVTIDHEPLDLTRSRKTITIEGAANHRWSTIHARRANHHTFEGPDLFGNAIAYGRFLFATRHVFGEALKLKSRETLLIDEGEALAVVWNLHRSDKEHSVLFGVLDWHPGDLVMREVHLGA
jgi:hypothetical protein